MPRPVALILTSHAQLGSSGARTGCWLEELAAAYYTLMDAGIEVELVSIRGGEAPIDPASCAAPWLLESGKRFLADETARAQLKDTCALEAAAPERFSAIYLVGGAGAAWDFTSNADLKRFIEAVDRAGDVVAGVCHGAIALGQVESSGGEPLMRGRMVTAISNAEDELAGYDKIVPALPEDILRKIGAHYVAAAPFAENVVRDRNILTGQNPASAAALARAVINALPR